MANLKNTVISGTANIKIPIGNSSQRPSSPQNSMVRQNNQANRLEQYETTKWESQLPNWTSPIINLDISSGVEFVYNVRTESTGTTTYSVVSGSLPAGLSLNGSTGAITGTPSAVTYNTTYNFTIRSTDTQSFKDQNFSVTVYTPMVATGGNVLYDHPADNGTWRVHAFTGSGTFTVNSVGSMPTVQVLIVAGGGSGASTIGQHKGGGGGAGGLVFYPNVTVNDNDTEYTITVGAGGAGVPDSQDSGLSQGNPGQNSSAFGITALGGGRGGQRAQSAGSNDGGSGGGGHYQLSGGTATQPAAGRLAGSPFGFGNPGGAGGSSAGYGGGGAGAPGAGGAANPADGTVQGGRWSGGIGLAAATINSVTYNFAKLFGIRYKNSVEDNDPEFGEIGNNQLYFAGGGGGGRNATGNSTYGAGGLGGGGRGAFTRAGDSTGPWGPGSAKGEGGRPNTGGGGGGARGGATDPGGSGVVLIRYRIQ